MEQKKPRIAHFIEIFLGWERETWKPSPEWLEHRIPFSQRYTIPSLKAQTACQVPIVIQASPKFGPRLRREAWAPGVEVSTDRGQELYAAAAGRADFIAITRLDSDDMMHTAAMAEVKAATLQLTMRPDRLGRRTVLRFPDFFTWDMVNGFIRTPGKTPPSTPFFTHIFNRKTVRNWPEFEELHFQPHGRGSGDYGALLLRPDRILVTKHGWNTSILKHGKTWQKATAEEAQKRCGTAARVTADPAEMAAILMPFCPGEPHD